MKKKNGKNININKKVEIMRKVLAIALIALTLAGCGASYYACPGVDGGRAARGCSR